MPKFIQNNEEIELGNNVYTAEINNLQSKLPTLEDPDEILDTMNSLIIYQNLNNDECKFFLPNLTFNDKLSIHGTLDSFDLRVINTAHSHGDIIGTSVSNYIAFIGDLLFVDEHPYLGVGDPHLLKEELAALLNSNIKHFIPGHGPVCGKEKVVEQIEYIDAITSLVRSNLDKAHKIKVQDLPSKFHNYKGPCFRWNINFLSEYLKEK